MNNSDEIISLYEKYGFELEDNQNPEKYLVFSHRKGYFQNAEILLIDLDFDFHNLEEGYKAAGFAVKINKYSNLDEKKNIPLKLENLVYIINASTIKDPTLASLAPPIIQSRLKDYFN